MKRKLLIICGPTATGKTTLALSLAKKFNGELVSADSRQVYRGLDIGTGKDITQNSSFHFPISNLKKQRIGCYEINGVRLWGYDLVDPKDEFSVAYYVGVADKIIENIWKRKGLPILVGGTGLYIKGVVDGIDTVGVPKDVGLRESLEGKSSGELYKILKRADSQKVGDMNISDTKNPRRLIRAIEVAKYKERSGSSIKKRKLEDADTLFVGLTAPKDFLDEKIKNRVEDRIDKGIEREIEGFIRAGVDFKHQSMQSLGYRQWKEYFEKFSRSGYEKGNTESTELAEDTEKGITESAESTESTEKKRAIEEWKRAEIQYAKRQMTWFKKDKRIYWYDISERNYAKSVEKLVREWYSSK